MQTVRKSEFDAFITGCTDNGRFSLDVVDCAPVTGSQKLTQYYVDGLGLMGERYVQNADTPIEETTYLIAQ